MSFEIGDIVVCALNSRVHSVVDKGNDDEGYTIYYLNGFGREFRDSNLSAATAFQKRQWTKDLKARIDNLVDELHARGQTHHKGIFSFSSLSDKEDHREWVAIAQRKKEALEEELHTLEVEIQ